MNESEIRVYYNDDEVSSAGLDENSLRLYYYNATNSSWEKYDGINGGVNTTENYVYAITNHFSTWGVYGNAVIINNNNNGGSSGGSWRNSDNDAKKLPDELLTIPPKAKPDEKTNEIIKVNEKKLVEPKQNSFFSGITGAVTGALGSIGYTIVIFFIIGIMALSVTIYFVRKRKKNSGY